MSDLQRFVTAQDQVYGDVLAELRAGDKTSHWMWFVFPQLAGLGRSPTAQRYAMADLAEARDYLAHPLLGARMRECAETLLDLETSDAVTVFGSIDAMKLRSSMTLFAQLEAGPFSAVLDRFFDGPDKTTLRLLRG
ncbi:MAG: DUF1810 domain-containing protein [Mycobacteriales bacterium]